MQNSNAKKLLTIAIVAILSVLTIVIAPLSRTFSYLDVEEKKVTIAEVENAVTQLNKIIDQNQANYQKFYILKSLTQEVDDIAIMDEQTFVDVLDIEIDGQCYIYNGFQVLKDEQTIVDIEQTAYVKLKSACEKLGFNLSEDEQNYILERAYASKRLLVMHDSEIENYGATDVIYVDDYQILQYAKEIDAYNAYNSLSKIYAVSVDTIIECIQNYSCQENKLNESDNLYSLNYSPNLKESELTAKDISYHNSWGVDIMGFLEYRAYLKSLAKPLPEVQAVVIDSGINPYHPLFENRIKNGISMINEQVTNDFLDRNGHGTHVAGTIAEATTDNVKIVPVTIIEPETGYAKQSSIVLAYSYVLALLDKGEPVKVVNCSYGGDYDSSLAFQIAEIFSIKLKEIIDRGVVVCAAAGNENMDAKYHQPAAIDGVVTVSAIDRDRELCYFSNYGSVVELCAPGESIRSAYHLDDGYCNMDGTSMSTPHIAAAVAQIFSNPIISYDAQKVQNTLYYDCAVDLGEAGRDIYYGYGMPDLSLLVPQDSSYKAPRVLNVVGKQIRQTYMIEDEFVGNISVSYKNEDHENDNITLYGKYNYANNVIVTSNPTFTFVDKDISYDFVGWYLGFIEGEENARLVSQEETYTLTNWDEQATVYIYAKVARKVIDVNIVVNFEDVDNYLGYIGYGVDITFEYYTLYTNWVDGDISKTVLQLSTTPKQMAFKIEDVPINQAGRIGVTVQDCAIKSAYQNNEPLEIEYQDGTTIFYSADIEKGFSEEVTIVINVLV